MTFDEILEDARVSFDKIQNKGFVNINNVDLDYYLVGPDTSDRFKIACKLNLDTNDIVTKIDKYTYNVLAWGVPIFSLIEDDDLSEKDKAEMSYALKSSKWQQISYFDFIGKLYNDDKCYDFFEINLHAMDLHTIDNTVFL